MDYRKMGKQDIVVRIDKGEEIVQTILKICKKEEITLASIQALGAVGEFEVGLFQTKEKKYQSKVYTGDFEIVSLTGNITLKEGEIYHHLHMSAADKNNQVYGGHLNRAIVSATCELFIHKIVGIVQRKWDDEIGLNLLEF